MRRLIWTSGTDVIEITEDPDAPIVSDFSTFEPNTVSGVYDRQTVYGVDGTVLIGAQLSSRQCVVTATVMGHRIGSAADPVKNVLDRYRRELCRAFNPKKGGRLTYHNGSGEALFINATPQSLPIFANQTTSTLTVRLDLIADDPYWMEAEEQAADFGTTLWASHLPTTLPTFFSEIQNMERALEVDTDLPIKPRVRINPTGLPVTVVNETTGRQIGLDRAVDTGCYVIIETTAKGQAAWLYRDELAETAENVTGWLTAKSSTEFELLPGINILAVNDAIPAEEGASAAVITWHAARLGV